MEEINITNFQISPIDRVCANEEKTIIEFEPIYIPVLQSLKDFSLLNAIWWFSDCDKEEARNTLVVSQPYKNAPATIGTFATRSPKRPNPIALSTTKIIYIDYQKGIINISHIDANDDTPVLDIKSYTPSFDRVETPAVPEWCSNWAKSLKQSAHFIWENKSAF